LAVGCWLLADCVSLHRHGAKQPAHTFAPSPLRRFVASSLRRFVASSLRRFFRNSIALG